VSTGIPSPFEPEPRAWILEKLTSTTGLNPTVRVYIGLPGGVLQGVPVQAAVHQQPAALICAADIWNACNTSSRFIGVIFGTW
jgi:hypothetical protein